MQQRLAPRERSVALGVGSGMLGAALTAIGLLVIVSVHLSGLLVVLFLVPILLAASWPAFVRQARRERNANIAKLLLAALVLKLVGSMVRYLVAVYVYDGFADSMSYHDYGAALAMKFRAGDFHTGLETLSDTNFIRFFTGVLYTVVGPSIQAGFLLYAWLAFWGTFYLYRAFTIAVPDGSWRSYARLLFFLPSTLYWPSSIGKESWMLFTLGLAAFGTARLLTGRAWRGLLIAGAGLYLATLVRPHVAGIAGLGLVMSYLMARPPRRLGAAGPVVKLLALVALAGLAVLLLGKTQAYLLDKGIDPAEGVNSVLAESARRTTQGGSTFAPDSAVVSPVKLPLATVTILFRPFLFEAHNAQAAVTALESTLLLWLAIRRRRSIWQAIRHPRRRPYVVFVGVYMAGFIFAFSTIANFGILARERTQLLPFFLVLLAMPVRRRPASARPVPVPDEERRADANRQLARA